MLKKIALLTLVLSFQCFALAVSDDAQDEDVNTQALLQTKQLLQNPTERRKVILETDNSKKADQTAHEVMGDNVEEMYHVSAEMMDYLVAEAKGDPEKMQKLIDNASRNPTSFLENLPQDYKDKIKNLADKSVLKKKSP